ncbi:MAG: hypothetical protein HYX51_03210 [Chloroflexi bacterium]|nr:hypothetical protein [Chloroflexota bacterium]
MTSRPRTLEEIRRIGLQALADALGPVDMVRFLQQTDNGVGDYTTERSGWLRDRTVSDIAQAIEARRGRDEQTD